jgi:hypothetical protein
MARARQNVSRAFREPRAARVWTGRASGTSRRLLLARTGAIGLLVALACVAALAVWGHTGGGRADARRDDDVVGTLLAAIPQEGITLGKRTAPVTLEIFADLKDPDCRFWFKHYLPAILRDDVRAGVMKIEYHAYKTNTYYPAEFVREHTAALAAGAQDKLWNFVYIFYREQGNELASYATEGFLESVASQVPGLNLALWHADRHSGRREERTTAEDHTANAIGLHVTPSFRIGRTGGAMKDFSGRTIIQFAGQRHPIALITAGDIAKAIRALGVSR